jgi:hypothetical protein
MVSQSIERELELSRVTPVERPFSTAVKMTKIERRMLLRGATSREADRHECGGSRNDERVQFLDARRLFVADVDCNVGSDEFPVSNRPL